MMTQSRLGIFDTAEAAYAAYLKFTRGERR